MIIKLNVGGSSFHTSSSTLEWIPNTFFTTLLNGKLPSEKDENGAYFIDRDPDLFKIILQYLRTKQFSLLENDGSRINRRLVSELLHECEFYGISPLIERLHHLEATFENIRNTDENDFSFTGKIPNDSRDIGGFMCGYDSYNQSSETCGDIHFNGLVEYVENRRPTRVTEPSAGFSKTVNIICTVDNYSAFKNFGPASKFCHFWRFCPIKRRSSRQGNFENFDFLAENYIF